MNMMNMTRLTVAFLLKMIVCMITTENVDKDIELLL